MIVRAALWFLALFALAAGLALLASGNQGMLSLFWQHYRVDISLNMALTGLVLAFLVFYAALRLLSFLGRMPDKLRRSRQEQRRRTQHQSIVSALAYLQSGRLSRARKEAQTLLHSTAEDADLRQQEPTSLGLQALAHLIAADSAHALQDRAGRDAHYADLLGMSAGTKRGSLVQVVREGAQMRSARWALDDQDPMQSLERLRHLPQGAARRTVALRIKLKAARLARDSSAALETTRLLAKHGGFTPSVARSLMGGLLCEHLRSCRDTHQLLSTWERLPSAERQRGDVALVAVRQFLQLCAAEITTLASSDSSSEYEGWRMDAAAVQCRRWLLPLWEQLVEQEKAPALSAGVDVEGERLHLWKALALTLQIEPEFEFEFESSALEANWLKRIEQAQKRDPKNAYLQYLVGLACEQSQLWGKAEQWLRLSLETGLNTRELRSSAWRSIAQLAERRQDTQSAAQAWRSAARVTLE